MYSLPQVKPCVLALESGEFFFGKSFGADGTSFGEIVFNTSMSGYQEILTDPSYKMQIITMTYPEIGNYGIHDKDNESNRIHAHGFVVKKYNPFQAINLNRSPLHKLLIKNHVIAIEGVDTRKITKIIRQSGSKKSGISNEILDPTLLIKKVKESTSLNDIDLTSSVTRQEVEFYDPIVSNGTNNSCYTIVVIDYGCKLNIIRELQLRGCRVIVMPTLSSEKEILSYNPDGILLSNGPGNPSKVSSNAIFTLKKLIGQKPIFGICFGHQMLLQALGYPTYKLDFGHHASNHPVKNLENGRIAITSQNHGFAVKEVEVKGGLTHLNINDQTNAGFYLKEKNCLSVQYHPEGSPGPHDSTYLFDNFIKMIHKTHAT